MIVTSTNAFGPVMFEDIPPRTAFQARMVRGHRARMGHTARFLQVSADGKLWHRVALCCGEKVPAQVQKWA